MKDIRKQSKKDIPSNTFGKFLKVPKKMLSI